MKKYNSKKNIWLMGGFGNVLFQILAFNVLSKNNNSTFFANVLTKKNTITKFIGWTIHESLYDNLIDVKNDGSFITGKVGSDIDKEAGKQAARQVALTMLSTIISHFREIDKIKKVVKVFGMVNATPEFLDHPFVINGFSELMVDVFGSENGIGVRSAVGMSLPRNIAVEIEAHFELYN